MATICHLERKGRPLCKCNLREWKKWAGTNWYCQFNSLKDGKDALKRLQERDPEVRLVIGKCPQVIAEERYKFRNKG